MFLTFLDGQPPVGSDIGRILDRSFPKVAPLLHSYAGDDVSYGRFEGDITFHIQTRLMHALLLGPRLTLLGAHSGPVLEPEGGKTGHVGARNARRHTRATIFPAFEASISTDQTWTAAAVTTGSTGPSSTSRRVSRRRQLPDDVFSACRSLSTSRKTQRG